MSTGSLDERAERARAELRRRQDVLTAATEAAQAETVTYETEGGDIRITVTGRLRIGEMYVSERALRSAGVEQRLVAAVNEALAAARTAAVERLQAELDADTAALVAAAEDLVGTLRDDAPTDVPGPRGEFR